MTLVSIQPFGLGAPSGGSRILRSLYRDAPMQVVSVVTGRHAPPVSGEWTEFHTPLRPPLGPIDGSRYDHWGNTVELLLAPGSSHRLIRACQEHQPRAIHAVAHSSVFWPALRAARSLGVPYLLSAHDDLRYLLRKTPLRGVALDRLGRAWREADARFVISPALGEEYRRRYGSVDYKVVTDGLVESDFVTNHMADPRALRCYFAGLFHRAYRPNLRAFLKAMELIAAGQGIAEASLVCRCGSLPERPSTSVALSVVDFGAEADVRSEMAASNLLYLPLMFGRDYRDMVAYSLSTKLVTYLASGVPIVYHGPPESAACELLAKHDAAILATSNDPAIIARAIVDGMPRANELTANARTLAQREFMLEDQRSRFWSWCASPAFDVARFVPVHEPRHQARIG